MTGLASRVLLVATGVASLLLWLGVAVAFAVVVGLVIAHPPNLALLAVALLASALAFGYLSYRSGAPALLSALDAKPVSRAGAPTLYAHLDALADEMAVDDPQVYVTAMDAPNALSVGGRGRGVIVLDYRLPQLLGPAELDAILAHELAHLEGYDGLVQTLAQSVLQTVAGFVFLALLPVGVLAAGLTRTSTYLTGSRPRPLRVHLARTHAAVAGLVVLVLLAFTLPVRAHSRRRERRADDRAVAITGDPLALARALWRIERASDPRRGLWASLYVHGDPDGTLTRLLATHPPMADRIQRLREQALADGRIPVDAT